MIRHDERFDLAVSDALEAERQQASLLRAFFRQCLARRSSGHPLVEEVNLAAYGSARPQDDDLREALAPLWPRENLVVFDAGALIANTGLATYALLTPMSLDRILQPTEGSASERLARVLALEAALRSCRKVIVFDARQARAMATLGASEVHVLPLPAMAQPALAPARPGGLLLVAHDVPEDTAPALASLLQVALRDLRITLVTSAERHTVSQAVLDDAAQASIHVHVGYAREPVAPLRVIDSMAARKPVIHLAVGRPPMVRDEMSQMQMLVEPFRTGFVAHSQTETVALVNQIRADAAMRDVFRRNLDRTAATFNAMIERSIWDLLA